MENSKKRIKMIWDFFGPAAVPTAEHHHKHLKWYATAENLHNPESGTEKISPSHSIAFLVVDESETDFVRKALKPNRGQYYDQ